MHYQEQREMICRIGRKMYDKGFVAANDGNISWRIGPDRYLATPSGISKGDLTPECLIIVNDKCELVEGPGKVSTEMKMHLSAFRVRPDVMAVCHAHPPISTGFAVAGLPIEYGILPEVITNLGKVPVVPFALPSTDELAESIVPYALQGDAFLLANHGVVALGDSLKTAWYRMEIVEHSAKILLTAKALGNINYLPRHRLEQLIGLRELYGIGGKQVDDLNGPYQL